MGGSSIFVTYGLKSGGGAPFLRRTRNAFEQLQNRTRSSFACSRWGPRQNFCTNGSIYSIEQGCGAANQVGNLSEGCWKANWDYCSQNFFNNSCARNNCIASTCYNTWSDWSDVTSCSPNVTRQCQTIYSFREQDWSGFEEAEECVSVSPTPANNAVEVECIAN